MINYHFSRTDQLYYYRPIQVTHHMHKYHCWPVKHINCFALQSANMGLPKTLTSS